MSRHGHTRSASSQIIDEDLQKAIQRYEDFTTTGKFYTSFIKAVSELSSIPQVPELVEEDKFDLLFPMVPRVEKERW